MAYSGRFFPQNPHKYHGDPTNIVYRSLWERKFMVWLDANENVISWSSEELPIMYKSPVDSRYHRYFPDFVVRVRNNAGLVNTLMIEIKPKSQTQPPKEQARKTKIYAQKVMTWGINEAKWKAADEFCKDRGWQFRLMTEEHLNIK